MLYNLSVEIVCFGRESCPVAILDQAIVGEIFKLVLLTRDGSGERLLASDQRRDRRERPSRRDAAFRAPLAALGVADAEGSLSAALVGVARRLLAELPGVLEGPVAHDLRLSGGWLHGLLRVPVLYVTMSLNLTLSSDTDKSHRFVIKMAPVRRGPLSPGKASPFGPYHMSIQV